MNNGDKDTIQKSNMFVPHAKPSNRLKWSAEIEEKGAPRYVLINFAHGNAI
jgi:hypothetical protein